MPLPTQFDHDLGQVQNDAALVISTLRNLHYSVGPKTRQYDVDRMRRVLREQLQDFVDHAIELGNQ